jgi:hypothetical protein
MFGSTALDVAVGLAFLYFVLGAICSHINELLAGLFSWRATYLEQGIRTLLADPALANKVWDHPLVRGLAGKPGRDPSYIPAQTFSLALFDALAPAPGTGPTFAGAQSAVTALPDSSTKQALQTILGHAQQSVATARTGVEDWYNAAMDRVSGVYKRRVQLVTLALSLFVAVGLGVDSVAIAQSLWQEPAVRAAVNSAAQGPAATTYEDPIATLTQFDLPLGWSFPPATIDGWILKIVGLAITTGAISLGAPFWFDILKKLGMNSRSSGPAPGEKP